MARSKYISEMRKFIGNRPLLLPSASALIFDAQRRVLLQRASDDGKWHTIGGAMEPAEEPAEAMIREVLEETGLTVRPLGISGVYTHPASLNPNGDVCLYIALAFIAEILSGTLHVADEESLEFQWFDREHLPELSDIARQTIEHAFDYQGTTWYSAP